MSKLDTPLWKHTHTHTHTMAHHRQMHTMMPAVIIRISTVSTTTVGMTNRGRPV